MFPKPGRAIGFRHMTSLVYFKVKQKYENLSFLSEKKNKLLESYETH